MEYLNLAVFHTYIFGIGYVFGYINCEEDLDLDYNLDFTKTLFMAVCWPGVLLYLIYLEIKNG